tara:strand:+ start:2355 stop:2651 length:297 start_codon:yes stop_codon:yes gene_type:complete
MEKMLYKLLKGQGIALLIGQAPEEDEGYVDLYLSLGEVDEETRVTLTKAGQGLTHIMRTNPELVMDYAELYDQSLEVNIDKESAEVIDLFSIKTKGHA